ncbi:DUF6226 family protein [Tsukamurella soli]|uniref:DUF6226 family protein n=1 Tax=Tsukamurella soli TaxID=644556 RepID=UPI0031E6B123
MSLYVRPSIPVREYRDESGAVIEYGTRWGAASPPNDSYSRTSNLDRFEPLHAVAGALIDHLADTYAVTVTPVAADDTGRRHTTIKTLTIAPRSVDAAPLLLRLTDFPAVEVAAGITHHVVYPDCGCDACDETWEDAAADLETLVLAVAAGTFNEQITLPTHWNIAGGKASVHHQLAAPDGSYRESSEHSVTSTDELRAAAARLDARPDRCWQPWTRR